MLKRLIVVTAIAWLVPLAAEALDRNLIIDQTNFIVDDRCSGTLVSLKERLVLTNHHCIDHKVSVVEREEPQPDGTVRRVKREKREDVKLAQHTYKDHMRVGTAEYIAEIVGHAKRRDLALLRLKAETLPHTVESKLLPDTERVRRGDAAWAVGNPAMLDASVTTGVISSVTRQFEVPWAEGEKLAFLQYSGGLFGGSSGGALYNEAGYLIGVPSAGHNQATFLGLAIPIRIVKEFLREACAASVWDAKAPVLDACLAEKRAKAEKRSAPTDSEPSSPGVAHHGLLLLPRLSPFAPLAD